MAKYRTFFKVVVVFTVENVLRGCVCCSGENIKISTRAVTKLMRSMPFFQFKKAGPSDIMIIF